MGFFSFLSGKTPESLMEKGNLLFDKGQCGLAKIEYEKAKARHAKKPAQTRGFLTQIDAKISLSCESLSRQHLEKGMDLLEAGCHEDALDRLSLALELAVSQDLRQEIEVALTHCHPPSAKEAGQGHGKQGDLCNEDSEVLPPPHDPDGGEDLETFEVLINTLSREEQEAYGKYGLHFIHGFVALNCGDFQSAARSLEQAHDEYPSPDNYIGLELATALLNLGELDRAQALLMDFLGHFPRSLRGYQILCEVLWINRAFDLAHQVLDNCPEPMGQEAPMVLLKGETWCREDKFTQAVDLYRKTLEQNGMQSSIVRALAGIKDSMGDFNEAFQLYAGLMATCTGCGQRPDVDLRRRFAHAGFAAGVMTSQIIDVYLDLVVEDPDNQVRYYENVSRIYAHLGNEVEAKRFNSFAMEVRVE